MTDYVVVNFSGGKDSTAMLMLMLAQGEHIDEVLFCDTTKEFPAIYRHIQKLKEIVEKQGVKFTVLRAEHDFDYFLFDHIPNRKNKDLDGKKGYGWPGCISRWCTAKLKVDVMEKHLRYLRKDRTVINCIGIAADEQRRLERHYAQKDGYRFPLVEQDMTEADCLKFCYCCGFDWEGLYEIFKRVSCWCCPLQSLAELQKLRQHFPDLWQELREMDKRTWRKFRADYSVEDLERRFFVEDLQMQFDLGDSLCLQSLANLL